MNLFPIKIAGTAVAVAAGAAAFEVAHLELIGYLVAAVVAVAALIAWIDSRISKQIKDHTVVEIQWRDSVLREIAHVKELLLAKIEKEVL